MNLLTLNSLISKLNRENKNVLILDTCCLLDIVRVPIRETIQPLQAALKIVNGINSNNFNIVLPSYIPMEWTDNISNVCDEVNKSIEKNQSKLTYLNGIVIELQSPVTIPDFKSIGIETQLRSISKKVLDLGLTLQEDPEYHLKGFYRSASKRPPARKGKESLKDCVVFEETLAIGNNLRQLGFDKKVVFASSNTQEFDNEDIRAELGTYNIQYVNSLQWGLHEVEN
ncbi:hypothetical protein J2S09_004123 [Bacillus fengqiuensis]|nr:hypothetical protein [Bacillus fengqiuensis]